MGIERIAMLKYGIPDLRTFYESDLRWLRHYGFLPLEGHRWFRARDEDDARLARTHLETDAPIDGIVRRLVMLGLEVESFENRAKDSPVLSSAMSSTPSRTPMPTA